MPFNQNARNLIRQPCTRDCTERAPGCAASCPKWAEYVKARDKDYARRADIKRVSDARCDGYSRLQKLARKR